MNSHTQGKAGSSGQTAPLQGVRVLALEQYLAGNIGSLYLAHFGAEVIKLEIPGEGDALRRVGPVVEANGRRRSASELRTMAGKKSIAVDLRRPEGLAAFWRLVPSVDVLWTNMKPSSLAKLGIDFERLLAANPRIIYSTLSGFGHNDVITDGPFGDWTAFDIIAQGLAGLQFRGDGVDGEPGYNGLPLGDFVTAIMTAMGTVMALLRRTKDGAGQRVDVSMHDAMVALNELPLGLLAFTGVVPPRGRSGTSAPYGPFRTSDGFVNIAVGGNPVWKRFCAALERSDLVDDDLFRRPTDRVRNFTALESIVTSWTSQRTSTQVVTTLGKHTVPCAPILDLPQVLASAQVTARHMLVPVDDPICGSKKVVGNPIKMFGVDDSFAPPPPDLAADTRAILSSLGGYSDSEITALAKSGAVGLKDD